eukprot:m.107623 g.107623  ORF g.107623 m.107623 type:complete len:420 (-) comp13326_c0_seq1:128-1387(-)
MAQGSEIGDDFAQRLRSLSVRRKATAPVFGEEEGKGVSDAADAASPVLSSRGGTMFAVGEMQIGQATPLSALAVAAVSVPSPGSDSSSSAVSSRVDPLTQPSVKLAASASNSPRTGRKVRESHYISLLQERVSTLEAKSKEQAATIKHLSAERRAQAQELQRLLLSSLQRSQRTLQAQGPPRLDASSDEIGSEPSELPLSNSDVSGDEAKHEIVKCGEQALEIQQQVAALRESLVSATQQLVSIKELVLDLLEEESAMHTAALEQAELMKAMSELEETESEYLEGQGTGSHSDQREAGSSQTKVAVYMDAINKLQRKLLLAADAKDVTMQTLDNALGGSKQCVRLADESASAAQTMLQTLAGKLCKQPQHEQGDDGRDQEQAKSCASEGGDQEQGVGGGVKDIDLNDVSAQSDVRGDTS